MVVGAQKWEWPVIKAKGILGQYKIWYCTIGMIVLSGQLILAKYV